jgi:hypothetical protein
VRSENCLPGLAAETIFRFAAVLEGIICHAAKYTTDIDGFNGKKRISSVEISRGNER